MKTLWIRDIRGLFNEMFEPNSSSFFDAKLEIREQCLNASNYFWMKFFDEKRIKNLIDIMRLNLSTDKLCLPQYKAIAANEEIFLAKVLNAPVKLCSGDLAPQDFFSALEIIEILCQLYSDFEYYPLKINVQDGFVLNTASSHDIYENCMNPSRNPYFNFVTKEIIPLIKDYAPDIIFLQGPPSYFLMTISTYIKKKFPQIHICITKHASEYYSMNKINHLLHNNTYLFNMIDSIILEYFEYGESLLIKTLCENKSLLEVPNLIFKNKNGQIIETAFKTPENKKYIEVGYTRPNGAVDIHLEPFIKCHWNKCTFCGINKKYHYENGIFDKALLEEKIDKIKQLSGQANTVWFTDEAMTAEQLYNLAIGLLCAQVKITWQVRCRADQSLLQPGLPELLAESGLKEIRIGLESASYYILNCMNKFDENFSLELMEEIICTYQKNDISIHCPIILGFPTEDKKERQKTYEFLSNMKRKYSTFSFNLNILNVDIKSKLFKEWDKFHLQQLAFPCPPQEFLGNCVAWISPKEHQLLDDERQKFMREMLFSWMPENNLLKPTTLYRLAETSRNTLVWKANKTDKTERYFTADMELRLTTNLSFFQESEYRFLIYNWDTHHYVHGNQYLLELLNCFAIPCKVTKAIKKLVKKNASIYVPDELIVLIQKLFVYKFFVGEVHLNKITNTEQLANEYNKIYQEESYFYKIEADKMLENKLSYIKMGKALELGIGMGKNLSFLLSHGFHVTGVDLSYVAIDKLRKKYPQCDFYVDDIRKFLIYPETYSIIICSMVLSYLTDEDLTLLIDRIIKGLIPGGCIYIIDLSESDPLNYVNSSLTTDHRNFLTKSKLARWLDNLQLIELSDIYKKDPDRAGCNGYFGLICYFGRKPEKNQ